MSVVIREPKEDGYSPDKYLFFGEYEEANLFHIEESSVYMSMGNNVCTVEFVLHHKDNEILLLEAKSSSPKPGNREDFDSFIDEIYHKFAHSMDLFFSLVLKRLDDLKKFCAQSIQISIQI